jgi:hypothetical protein
VFLSEENMGLLFVSFKDPVLQVNARTAQLSCPFSTPENDSQIKQTMENLAAIQEACSKLPSSNLAPS